MKKTKLFMLFALPLLLTGCVETIPTKAQVVGDIPSFLAEEPKSYHIIFDYDDDYFKDSYVYSKDIQMLSYGASMATGSTQEAMNFYLGLSFDNIKAHLPKPTVDSVGYVIAHKTMVDADLVSLTVRGLDYGAEWMNNLTIGKEGNHEGFELRANEIYNTLSSYLEHYRAKPVKLWITGYSRGGAISNVLASKIMEKNFPVRVAPQNLFVYTFEAPCGLTKEHALEYKNVYNIVNTADLVAKIPPAEYGLYRCGTDVVYSDLSDIDEKLAELDPTVSLPAFEPGLIGYDTDETALSNYLISYLLEDTEDPETTLSTREGYVNNYQEHLCFFLNLYLTAPAGTFDLLVQKLQETSPMDLLTIIGSQDETYNFIKPVLDETGTIYDETALYNACGALVKLVTSKFMIVLGFFAVEQFKYNVIRCIDFHAMEIVYLVMR